jgi:RNA polymerase sigma-70 factor, ECF subfamily
MSDTSMHDLAARLARGDEAAFTELYDACADRLHGYLSRHTASNDVASDVLQTVFLRAVKNRRRFRKVENPVAYLFQIARNEAARLARRRRRANEHQTAAGDPADRDASYQLAEDAEMVSAALARLDGEDREIVELKIYGGLTFSEIANVVDRPQATVATRYRRSLESLRNWLAKQFR